MAIKGVDISENNGSVDFSALKNAGVQFVIIRLGYGGDYTNQDDSKFLENVKKAKAAGMPYGVYLYSYALNTSMAQSEVNHTLRVLKQVDKPAYGVWFDMEDADGYKQRNGMPSKETLVQICDTYCKAMQSAGYQTGIYASLSWLNNQLNDPRLDVYDKWVAQWNATCDYKKPYTIWQYAGDNGPNVTKIGGKVFDMNYAYKDYANTTAGGDTMPDNTAARVLELARGELGATSGSKYVSYYNQITGAGLPLGCSWCACFVTWVMRHAGVPTDSVLNYKGCSTASEWFLKQGRFMGRDSGYVPKPGDIIMYEWNPENEGTSRDDGDDHTGIVEYVQDGRVHTIEGNNGGKCQRDWWSLGHKYISGYCVPLYNIEKPKEEDVDMTKEEVVALIRDTVNQMDKEKAEKPASDWAKNALDYGVEHHIMVGDGGGKNLRPQANITRQEVMQMFYNVLTAIKTEDDLPKWAKEAVDKLIAEGVVAGTGKTEEDKVILNISEELVRMLVWMVRYMADPVAEDEGES